MKRILLLNLPSNVPCSRSLHRANIEKPGYVWPPVDLVCLSGYLWEAEYDLTYKDFQVDRNESIWSYFSRQTFDVVIATYSPHFENEDLALLKDISVAYPTAMMVLLANHKDRIDRKHAEIVLRNCRWLSAIVYDYSHNNLADFINGDRSEAIFNLCFIERDNFIINFRALPLAMEIPVPKHELFKSGHYFHYDSTNGYTTATMSSFGCTRSCPFCWGPQLYPHATVRTVNNLIAEMEYIVTCGFEEVYFNDLMFAQDTGHTIDFCRQMIKRNIPLRWFCSSRFDAMTPELIRLMAEAGCRCIEFGLESGNADVRKKYGKDISDESINAVIRSCHAHGISSAVFLILGFPEETFNDMKRSLSFVNRLKPDYLSLNILWAEPLTDIGSFVSIANGIASDDFASKLNFIHPYVTQPDIDKLYKKALRQFYLQKHSLYRQLVKLRSWKRLKHVVTIVCGLIRRRTI